MAEPMKRCAKCRRLRPVSAFSRDRRAKSGVAGTCKRCAVKANRAWRHANPAKVRAYDRARRTDGQNAIIAKRWRDGLKRRVIAAYGGACGCCGESDPAFLSLDHIDGIIPAAHRTRAGKRIGGAKLYKIVLDEGCPPAYRILCFNCNWAIGHLGYCPHQRRLRSVA
jgi:hypothetical protein